MVEDIADQVTGALHEDRAFDDVTAALLPKTMQAKARIITREGMILCGRPWVEAVFVQLDAQVTLAWQGDDGDRFSENDLLCEITGPAWALLAGERTALNFLQTLSATATQAWEYSQVLIDGQTQLLDTRKTLPGWRLAQKYAVRCGGGHNHRHDLAEAYLIKENHLTAVDGIANAVQIAREQHPELLLEVEVETLDELKQALDQGVERVLLDNFDLDAMKQAVVLNKGRAQLEVSGNVTIKTLPAIAATGVDFVSVGAITKHIQAIDLSMQLELESSPS